MDDLSQYISQLILNQAKSLKYRVADEGPDTYEELVKERSLVIWSGGTDNSMFSHPEAYWAFRALHDKLHLDTGTNFAAESEMELGRIQASKYDGIVADLVYAQVAAQNEYYLKNGVFVPNERDFTIEYLKKKGIKL